MRHVLYCLPCHVKTEYQDREHYKVNGENIIERLVAHERRHRSRSCVFVQGIYSGIHMPGGFSGITFPLGCAFLVVIRPSREDEGALVERVEGNIVNYYGSEIVQFLFLIVNR